MDTSAAESEAPKEHMSFNEMVCNDFPLINASLGSNGAPVYSDTLYTALVLWASIKKSSRLWSRRTASSFCSRSLT